MRRVSKERSREMLERPSSEGTVKLSRSNRHSPPEDPRLKNRPPEPPVQSSNAGSKKKKKESNEKAVSVFKVNTLCTFY